MDGLRTGYIALVLDTNRSTYASLERRVLSEMGEALRAVVLPALDEKTQKPVITDLDEGTRIRVCSFFLFTYIHPTH